MRPAAAVARRALAVLFAAAPPARPQTASAFTGNYRLTLTFGAACTARVRSVSVFLAVTEKAITRGSEVDGRPAIADETGAAEVTLQRVGAALHGPFATLGSRAEREPITSVEGYWTGLWLVLDGTVTSGSGRPSARGTAVGLLEAGRPEDDSSDSLGSCTAADHSWYPRPRLERRRPVRLAAPLLAASLAAATPSAPRPPASLPPPPAPSS